MTVSHLTQLCQLQDENAKLKRMYADLTLIHLALKEDYSGSHRGSVSGNRHRVADSLRRLSTFALSAHQRAVPPGTARSSAAKRPEGEVVDSHSLV